MGYTESNKMVSNGNGQALAWKNLTIAVSVVGLLVTLLGIGIRNAIVVSSFMAKADAVYVTKDYGDTNYLSSAVYEANHKALIDVVAIQIQENTRELDELSILMKEHINGDKNR